MKLKCTGTGYISSNITESTISKNNGEKIVSCYFQFANLKFTDKFGNRKYSKYLCIAIGNVAKLIIDNFVKGQKVLISGELEQKTIKNKNYQYDNNLSKEENKKRQYTNIDTITINHIEFMANPKNDKYEKENNNKDSTDDVIENIDTSNMNNENEEIFT